MLSSMSISWLEERYDDAQKSLSASAAHGNGQGQNDQYFDLAREITMIYKELSDRGVIVNRPVKMI